VKDSTKPLVPAKAGTQSHKQELDARFRGHERKTGVLAGNTMANPVDYAINHARLTIAALAFLLIAGLVAYLTIPKEAEPDVKIPIIYTLLSQRGISP